MLSQKHCVPCEGGTEPLQRDKIDTYLPLVPDWQLSSDEKSIARHFVLKNFKEALAFVNKVGAIAEEEGHHPDIFLHNWKEVDITLSTHAIGGLSENDFILAAKIHTLL